MALARVYLASASPRRLQLLAGLGLAVTPCAVPVDESPHDGEPPAARVARLAEAKVRAALASLGAPAALPADAVVLGADTTVVEGGASLDKPEHAAEAVAILRRLQGKAHEVLTGVCVLRPATGAVAATVARTRVRLLPADDATIAWYVGTGEPLDKAGAYGIQGLGALLVEGIEGSWSNVVGLPLERLPALLREVGLPFPL
jgi:septum formation protein